MSSKSKRRKEGWSWNKTKQRESREKIKNKRERREKWEKNWYCAKDKDKQKIKDWYRKRQSDDGLLALVLKPHTQTKIWIHIYKIKVYPKIINKMYSETLKISVRPLPAQIACCVGIYQQKQKRMKVWQGHLGRETQGLSLGPQFPENLNGCCILKIK